MSGGGACTACLNVSEAKVCTVGLHCILNEYQWYISVVIGKVVIIALCTLNVTKLLVLIGGLIY